MKSLLMATDLSARSDRALERAVSLAQEHDADLTILHVVDEDLPASLANAHEKAARQDIRKHLDKQFSGAAPRISIEVLFGRAYVDILEMSEKTKAEMIVLGLHREASGGDLFRGTTVERVIRNGDIPTLLVKDRVGGPYGRVIVGVDFSVYSRRAVEFAVNFAPTGEFYLVHAYDVPFKGFLPGHDTRREVKKEHQVAFEKMIGDEMATFLAAQERQALKIETVLEEGTVRDVIKRQTRHLNPDLLVIGTHGRTGVAHAFLGSVAEDLLRDPPCDVLAVKAW